MSEIAIAPSAVTARTAAFCLAVPGAKYDLPQPVGWRLTGAGATQAGMATKAVELWHDLTPDTDYRLDADGFAPLSFRTAPCAGLIDAADYASTDAADNTAALQRAIDAVPAGGTLMLPKGRWLSGPLFLKSAMTLYLADGAELAAITDRAAYPVLEPWRGDHVLGSWEGLPDACFAALITAIDCRDLAITGPGIIDGGGDRGDWWTWPKETRDGARRPRVLHLIGCEDLTLAGPVIRNSPSWTVHPYRCRRLTAVGLSVQNPAESPNTDGFDPESCEDVTIEGVHFSVGDDCIAIKAGKRALGRTDHLLPTRNVAVRHCLMERGHGGVVLGSEMSGGIHGVTVEDCDMRRTDRGLRIKTRRGRGGAVTDVTFRRVVMDGVDTAITANAFYFCDPDGKDEPVQSREAVPVDETTPRIADILVEDVELKNLRIAVAALLGLPEAPVENVRLARLSASFDPQAQPASPLMACHVKRLRHAGIITEFTHLTIGEGGLPDGLSVSEGISTPC
ncbi:glycoside hydrolase family 28 protein [Consotaella aegiceratis]|uniref:polygalacturonase PglA n=1 Tax=Consotaella aegiceratis TaxID=3097961 RepID=UPI002F3F808B